MQTILVVHCEISNKRTLYFVFDCYISDKRRLYFFFIPKSVMSERSVLFLIVILVITAHYICTTLLG